MQNNTFSFGSQITLLCFENAMSRLLLIWISPKKSKIRCFSKGSYFLQISSLAFIYCLLLFDSYNPFLARFCPSLLYLILHLLPNSWYFPFSSDCTSLNLRIQRESGEYNEGRATRTGKERGRLRKN